MSNKDACPEACIHGPSYLGLPPLDKLQPFLHITRFRLARKVKLSTRWSIDVDHGDTLGPVLSVVGCILKHLAWCMVNAPVLTAVLVDLLLQPPSFGIATAFQRLLARI